ncbi:metallophosphoesterase family protein [Neorhodopirellula pilleata]|uniref:Putative metallophosphoesterase YhaO n=1 Tax=Neorhodopirellula pilleata TaxID=2714738 RepID=A0A5C6AHX7_9BACT|nr:DNA repair exonuclease [Neorhodopirellula pilleata]TWT99006.1 putative metallophosphoesterase YhaO [Neorhodopirellula pilleata]
MFKFIHCADIHLDSPLRGLEKYEGAPVDEIRGAVRRAMNHLFELAIEEKVTFVLIAGDIYDGKWDDHQTGLYFVKWLSRFHEHDIPVYAITGNHDAANKMTKFLHLPSNPNGQAVMLSSQFAETVRLDDIGVAIHGRGFADQEERENLVLDYPTPVSGYFNIGMLHTSLDGAVGGEHQRYAPCSPADLWQREYQYWALGHVHTRKHHHKPDQTPIVFPGNLQGRHVRETGPKGCELVTVDNAGNVSLSFQTLDVFRFEICDVDVGGVREPDEVFGRFNEAMQPLVTTANGLPIAVRVIVSGASEAHNRWLSDLETWQQSIRANAFSIDADVWIEKVQFKTQPLRTLSAEDMSEGAIAELMRCFEEAQDGGDLVSELLAELEPLRKKLPIELQSDHDQWIPGDAASLREILAEVQPMLLQRLMTENQR